MKLHKLCPDCKTNQKVENRSLCEDCAHKRLLDNYKEIDTSVPENRYF